MKYKHVRYRFAWQCIRRFECGVRFYVKGRTQKNLHKYYLIKNQLAG